VQSDNTELERVSSRRYETSGTTPPPPIGAKTLYNMQKHKTECDLYFLKLSERADDLVQVKYEESLVKLCILCKIPQKLLLKTMRKLLSDITCIITSRAYEHKYTPRLIHYLSDII
jgi:hypothetical protein